MRLKNTSMRKGLFTLLLLSGTFGAVQAQQIRAGVNFANISTTASGRADASNMLTSFQVGLIGNIKLGTNMLALQPGILFTGKGAKVQYREPGQVGYYKQSTNPYYIEVPVNLVVKPPVGGGSHFFFGAGPYVAMGITGKVRTEGSALLGVNGERSIRFSNDDPSTFNQEEGTGFGILRRFDYGLNGTAGFEGKLAVIGVNYGLGLAKLQSGSNSNADDANKHRVLSVFVGIKL
ncbi:PorT family protein [Flaviaesturariibacter aridisoli]|uniref:PorT family protein n=2 Tax=Flaviaesturariibacter aridisoli TaxID=2545761 RepID=A0A4R4DRW3_9BACT|nr:PorT family protein [Flaviaesturariibacter aridisoli]